MGQKQSGFTILELLVAMIIFSFIGLGSHAMLRTIIGARETEMVHSQQLGRVQKALWVMGQDLAQMQAQSLRMPDDTYAASFNRKGFSNPLGLARSDVLKVAYRLEGYSLKRYYWTQQAGATQQEQVLLEDVRDFSMRQVMNRSVEIGVTVAPYGAIKRVVEVPDL